MSNLSIVFAGTPDFAQASLMALIQGGLAPSLVLTQPDRPSGRGRRSKASAVKLCAVENAIEVYQPTTLRTEAARAALRREQPDVLVVAAYGLLLPAEVLEIPRVACVNVHASLLPRWRGAAPIQAALLAGDATTGISLMKMDRGLDTGPVYCRQPTPIQSGETAGELHDRLAVIGGELLVGNLAAICRGALSAEAQDDEFATYAGRLSKADALIDWSQSAGEIERAVRAYNPWPVSHTLLDGQTLRIWYTSADADASAAPAAPGTITAADSAGIDVACGEGTLKVRELQLAGRRRLAAGDFANQRHLPGLRLGE